MMFYDLFFCSCSTAHASCQDKGIIETSLHVHYIVVLLWSVYVSLPACATCLIFYDFGGGQREGAGTNGPFLGYGGHLEFCCLKWLLWDV